MLILNKTRINILVDVHFLIPTFQVVLIHINKVGNRINKVGHETTKWVNESTKWVNESTSWTAPNQPGGSRQLYDKVWHKACVYIRQSVPWPISDGLHTYNLDAITPIEKQIIADLNQDTKLFQINEDLDLHVFVKVVICIGQSNYVTLSK